MTQESDSTDALLTEAEENSYAVQTDGGTEPRTVTEVSELFAEQKEDLDEEWHDTFDALTAQGKSPSAIKATVEYVTAGKTQSEVSDGHNVSEVTIRNLQAAVVALGPVDGVQGKERSGMRKMDYCNHLADRLGWEEGVEYGVNKAGYNDTPSPTLHKPGWEDLYEVMIDAE